MKPIVGNVMIWGSFGIFCVAVVPLMDRVNPGDAGAILVYTRFGAICAAAGLIAIWMVLGPGKLLQRLRSGYLVGGGLIFCWFVGACAAPDQLSFRPVMFWRAVLTALIYLAIIHLAIQSPLWLMRIVFRWGIESPGDTKSFTRLTPLTISHVMAATGVVAVALAAARFAKIDRGMPDAVHWEGLLIGNLIAAGISTISLIPAVILGLRLPNVRIGTIVLCLYCAGAIIVTLVIISLLSPYPIGGEDAMGFIIVVVAFAAGLFVPLLIWRRQGYRLHWGREPVAVGSRTADATNAVVADNRNGDYTE